MYVDALFRIAVQRRSQVYALSDQLVQQFDVNPSMEAAWILKDPRWRKTLADERVAGGVGRTIFKQRNEVGMVVRY